MGPWDLKSWQEGGSSRLGNPVEWGGGVQRYAISLGVCLYFFWNNPMQPTNDKGQCIVLFFFLYVLRTTVSSEFVLTWTQVFSLWKDWLSTSRNLFQWASVYFLVFNRLQKNLFLSVHLVILGYYFYDISVKTSMDHASVICKLGIKWFLISVHMCQLTVSL